MNITTYSSWNGLVGMFDECYNMLDTTYAASPLGTAFKHDKSRESFPKKSVASHPQIVEHIDHNVIRLGESDGSDSNKIEYHGVTKARSAVSAMQEEFGKREFAHFAEFLDCMGSVEEGRAEEHTESSQALKDETTSPSSSTGLRPDRWEERSEKESDFEEDNERNKTGKEIVLDRTPTQHEIEEAHPSSGMERTAVIKEEVK